ncbi:cytochrome P450 [Frankia sp. AgB1.9]|uniref:cytochrome P450 n=1 Tax=unclassified Frankia TaxID=2632575 RepID=UPI0019319702|nr:MULTISPECIES: cytochrome P450 [unclassified Frankia]MBL7486888.1 cytochrome P450 [Frankia sp. AgW1.1]MBL7547225.1 cytochrome P450 [Frankia sp. AgB1.9]MBL7623983.1 cytochrome P450 [Frankia sp. AgB1.8]
MTLTNDSDVYYDPFDFAIDDDPYPVWRRMRDEKPLYYNERYDFFALSRYEDVSPALTDWQTYRSGKGSVLEIIRADIEIPPGVILFEDPPRHDIHRSLLARVFTPKKMTALEPKVREFTTRCLDPLVEGGEFDFVRHLGAQMPMRTIGFLLGIPESDQEAIRDQIDRSMNLEHSTDQDVYDDEFLSGSMFADYIDWRARHPSDDLMTELLTAEFEDETGTVRRLTRAEVLTYVTLLAGAGNETTTRLIGWTGKLLAEHPDQRRQLAADHSLIPNAIEEILRYEAPSPIQARYVAQDVELHGQTVPEGSVMALLNASANRDDRHFDSGETFDIRRRIDRHLTFGYGIHFCLGAALARLEGRVALDEVLNRWTDWEIDWPNAKMAHTSTTRGWESLPALVR